MPEATALRQYLLVAICFAVLLLPGLACVHAALRGRRELPLASLAFLALCVSFAILALTGSLAVAVGVSCRSVLVVHLALALGGLLWLATWGRRDLPAVRRIEPASALLACFLLGDAALAAYAGTPIKGDPWVHMAKIHYLVQHGFGLTDPFFRDAIESRYHFNVIHWFGALVSDATGMSALDTWHRNFPFYRVLVWLGYFTALHLLTEDEALSSFAVLLAIVLWGAGDGTDPFWDYGNQPNHIVGTWLLLWLGASLRLLARPEGLAGALVVLAALLVAFTHPTYSLWLAGATLLLLVSCVLLGGARREPVRRFWAVTLIPLLIPAVISWVTSPHMPESVVHYRVPELDHFTRRLYGVEMQRLVLRPALAACGLLAFYGVTRRGAVLTGGIPLLLFYDFLARSPFVFPLATRIWPFWLVCRAQLLPNLTCNLLILLGVALGMRELARRGMPIPPRAQLAAILALFVLFPTPLKQTHRKDRTRSDKASAERLQRLFAGLELDPGATVIASLPDSYRVPALVDLGVVAIDRNHASPAVAIEEREEDLALLLAGDLEAHASLVDKYAARYVLTSSPELDRRFARQRLMREQDGYRLYEIVRERPAATRPTARKEASSRSWLR